MAVSGKHFRKRHAILEYLRNTDAHPSADMVYFDLKQEIPDLSLGTVYRNLAMFKSQGLITSLGSVKGVERFDAHTQPHVHFICSCCDRVMDLPQLQIPEELRQTVCGQTGGSVDSCQLTFTGLCRDCLLRQEEKIS